MSSKFKLKLFNECIENLRSRNMSQLPPDKETSRTDTLATLRAENERWKNRATGIAQDGQEILARCERYRKALEDAKDRLEAAERWTPVESGLFIVVCRALQDEPKSEEGEGRGNPSTPDKVV